MRWIFISKNFSNKVCSGNKKTLNSYNFYIWVEMIFLWKYTSACNILIIIDLSTKMKGEAFSVYDLMIIFSFLWSKKGGKGGKISRFSKYTIFTIDRFLQERFLIYFRSINIFTRH